MILLDIEERGSLMAQILLGKAVADARSEDLIRRVDVLKKKGIQPKLVIVRVGEKPEDLSYERGALNRAKRIGVETEVRVFQENASTDEVLGAIAAINEDPKIHGCLIFRPLPKTIDERIICESLAPEKDVDGIGSASMAHVFMNQGSGFAPCTAEAVLAMLKHYNIPISGSRVTVIGRSLVIGKPVSMMLLNENATVTICHTRTRNLAFVTRESDIIVACAGKALMVDEGFVREGQTVIDVGINVNDEGKLVGDVDFDSVEPIVANITPTPRGVGSVTTTMLMQHVVEAAEKI
ncbi:MAG: bifunctional 5,10-methylenetetrahydrofolate dehydrogenase/5,10-methenyltetrahydrofolate cyclohydrolase [Saccharofermentanales bacterium]|jgi:methylenetetrahydrofolate dehydrogenase (NADP+)/methenyltetrahydrofolate cyclohydrolase